MLADAPLTVAAVVRGRRNPAHLSLAERLKKARERAGITRRRLSLDAGLSALVARNVEAGTVPRLDIAEKLARAVGVDACWLAFGPYGGKPFQDKIPRAEQVEGLPPQLPPAPADAPLSCLAVGSRLVEARKAAGLSRAELGRRTGIAHSAIGYVEEGRTLPGVDTVEQLAAALDVSPCLLAYGRTLDLEGKAPRHKAGVILIPQDKPFELEGLLALAKGQEVVYLSAHGTGPVPPELLTDDEMAAKLKISTDAWRDLCAMEPRMGHLAERGSGKALLWPAPAVLNLIQVLQLIPAPAPLPPPPAKGQRRAPRRRE